jgi:tryptophan synthase beta subunit
LLNISGRGDKDVETVRHLLGDVDAGVARKEGAQ